MDEIDEEMEDHYRVLEELRAELEHYERTIPSPIRIARSEMFQLQALSRKFPGVEVG